MSSRDPKPDDPQTEFELQSILDALRGLRFGSVQIFVQDEVVIQVDRTEKRRLRVSQPSKSRAADRH